MKRQWLHEAAKVCVGLVAADFIMLWWLTGETYTVRPFLGIAVSPEMIGPAMFIDFFLFLILVHYAWNVGKLPRVKERMYFLIAGVIFAVVCAAHLFRVLTGSTLVIYDWSVPLLLSWIGVFVTLYLSYASFYLAGRRK